MSEFRISEAHHLDKADEAPDQPGLYVWYGRLSVGAADWDETVAGSNSIAQGQLLRALRDHSVKHRQQPLQLDAVANFSTRWSGGLGPILPEAWDDESVGTWTADGEHEIARATASNSGRSELLSLLGNVFPLFCSPSTSASPSIRVFVLGLDNTEHSSGVIGKTHRAIPNTRPGSLNPRISRTARSKSAFRRRISTSTRFTSWMEETGWLTSGMTGYSARPNGF